jgi:glycosyltransferase involved in cell wall biosynthesis
MVPDVSIVVVTHDALPYCRVLFSSLGRTRGATYETVVVDNASSPATRRYLARLQRAGTIDTLCLRPDNALFARACNLGAQISDPESERVLLLNPDVEIRDPNWLALLLEAHEGGATGYGLLTDEAGARTDGYCLLIDRELLLQHPLDERYPGWWCVARLQAELLSAGAPVQAISDHDHLLFHFGRKSGPGFASAQGAKTPPATVRGWFAGRSVKRLSARELASQIPAASKHAALSRRNRALARIEDRLERLGEKLDMLCLTTPARLDALSAGSAELGSLIRADHDQLRRILRAIAAEEAPNRSRLGAARAAPDYELAFTDPDPMVSIVIPTHDRAELLRGRSVASALAQSHERLEVVVVGDDSPPEVEDAVRSFADPRVRFHRVATPYRAREDPRSQWLVRSVMARNEGLRLARGAWLLAFDDDDEMCPDQVAKLLALARDSRAEVVYGLASRHWSDGSDDIVGAFPPTFGQFTWQCALYHRGLGFFERQLVATDFELPSDWFMCESMLRAGVRFAMLDEIVCRIYPSAAMHAEVERQRTAAAEEAQAAAEAQAPQAELGPARPPTPHVTPWNAPSRFGPAGELARVALRRVIRPLEVRMREADQGLTDALAAQQAQLGEVEAKLDALRDRTTAGAS